MSDSGRRDDRTPKASTSEGSIAGREASVKRAPSANVDPNRASVSPSAEPLNAEPPTAGRGERRGAVRKEPHEFKSELRLAVAGFPMRLVNLSSTGLLAETNQRLCPGRAVDVFLRYGGIRKVLRATVIRSTMHAVSPNPVFRAALQFEDVLTLQDAEL